MEGSLLKILHEVFGVCLFCLAMYSLRQKSDDKLKTLLSLVTLGWSINFLIVGAYTAAGVQLATSTRIFLSRFTRNRYLAFMFIAMYICILLLTYVDQKDIFSAYGGIAGTVAMFFLSGVQMRMLMATGTTAWLLHNIMVNSYAGMLAEATLLIILLITINEMRKEKRNFQDFAKEEV